MASRITSEALPLGAPLAHCQQDPSATAECSVADCSDLHRVLGDGRRAPRERALELVLDGGVIKMLPLPCSWCFQDLQFVMFVTSCFHCSKTNLVIGLVILRAMTWHLGTCSDGCALCGVMPHSGAPHRQHRRGRASGVIECGGVIGLGGPEPAAR